MKIKYGVNSAVSCSNLKYGVLFNCVVPDGGDFTNQYEELLP